MREFHPRSGAGGGAARGIAHALCESGIAHLGLLDRNPEQLRVARHSVAGNWPDVPISTTRGVADILINATTLGKADDDRMPFESNQILGAGVVCDVVIRHGETRLMEFALERDRMAISGPGMGAAQLGSQLSFLCLKTPKRASRMDNG